MMGPSLTVLFSNRQVNQRTFSIKQNKINCLNTICILNIVLLSYKYFMNSTWICGPLCEFCGLSLYK